MARAAGAVLVVAASGFVGGKLGLLTDRVARASHNFSDVPDGAFYHAFVDYLARSGVTAGCAVGLYCPDAPVTRGQMAVFLGKQRLLDGCPPDSVRAGATCVDKYEASAWKTTDVAVIEKIQLGTVTLADLQGVGALQLGLSAGDLAANGCAVSGTGCVGIYAVSMPGVTPAIIVSWFQAVAMARNAGKRLPTNQEWQAAALGTPDGAPCRTTGAVGVAGTPGCVSDVGAFDMVGNVYEWVDAWLTHPTTSPGWGAFSDDLMALGGAATAVAGPGALVRGGGVLGVMSGPAAGPFAVTAGAPYAEAQDLGFRAAR
jgi:hypothetical protein